MELAIAAAASAAGMAGVDFSKNLSYYAIPAAWLCAHGPHLYSIIGAGPKLFDNRDPRTHRDRLAKSTTLTQAQKEYFFRVKSASDNGYETLGLFAAAVVAGNQGGLRSETLNVLSWGYIATRLAYNYVYIKLGANIKVTPFRSALWATSIFISLGLFVAAGVQFNKA